MENDNYFQKNGDIENIVNSDNVDAPDNAGCPVYGENRTQGGQYLFSAVIIILACFVAVPVLAIYFLRSPLPLQDVYTFGISYYNSAFIFLISAAVVIISVLFFFKSSATVILVIFITCLFSCVPLIIGLKNNLTLQQAIENIPFFVNWPFFLNPLYIFVEFLLPAGILAFLFLQLKNIFSKKPNNYGFLGAAGYLSAAAFIGFTGLNQAGKPNIVNTLLLRDNIPVVRDDQTKEISRVSENQPDSIGKLQSSVPLGVTPRDALTDQSESPLGPDALPTEYSKTAMVDRKVQSLEDKISRISKELEQVRISLKGQDRSVTGGSESLPLLVLQNGQQSDADDLADIDHSLEVLSDKINQMDESLEKFIKPVVDSQPSAIIDVRHKVELLSGRVDQLLSRFNQAGYFNAQQPDFADRKEALSPMVKGRDITPAELTRVLQKIELLSDKVNRISDALAQKGIYVTGKGEIQN